jgi:hypothetical protein
MPAPRGRYKIKQPADPRQAILNGVQVVPDFTLPVGQKMPAELTDKIAQKVRQRRR